MDSLHFAPTFSYFSTENCSYSGKKHRAFICHYVRARREDFLQAQQFSHLLCFQAIVLDGRLSINISLFLCSSEVSACLTCSLNELYFRHCSVSDKKYLRTVLLEV